MVQAISRWVMNVTHGHENGMEGGTHGKMTYHCDEVVINRNRPKCNRNKRVECVECRACRVRFRRAGIAMIVDRAARAMYLHCTLYV